MMAGPEFSQSAQIYEQLDVSAEPPCKKIRVHEDVNSEEIRQDRLNDMGEAVSSDNGDSGFGDLAGRCDDSSSDSDSSVSRLDVGSNPYAWVNAQMEAGTDPRPILEKMLPTVQLPPRLDRLTMWNLIVELLGEDDAYHKPPRQRLPNVQSMEDALKLLTTCKKIVVLTGAGVSVSCGIPDFRSKDGIYARLRRDFPTLPDPQAMFDMRFFKQDPRPFFKFAREIYPGQFEPSASHKFIQGLEARGQLLHNYTQNIDTLEAACGIKNVIACHGSFATATCTRCGYKVNCEALREDIFAQRVPLCPKCPQPAIQHWEEGAEAARARVSQGGHTLSEMELGCSETMAVMKPDIVFFGEGLPDEFHRHLSVDKDDADLLIVMGSSLKVKPVASIPQRMDVRVPQILINREPLPHIDPFDVQLLGDCDVVIRELCSRLDGWQNETWVESSRPESEPSHPYTIVDHIDGTPVPKNQSFIFKVDANKYAFSGAELESSTCSSDEDDSDSGSDPGDGEIDESEESNASDCSDSELIEFLMDTLVNRVADNEQITPSPSVVICDENASAAHQMSPSEIFKSPLIVDAQDAVVDLVKNIGDDSCVSVEDLLDLASESLSPPITTDVIEPNSFNTISHASIGDLGKVAADLAVVDVKVVDGQFIGGVSVAGDVGSYAHIQSDSDEFPVVCER